MKRNVEIREKLHRILGSDEPIVLPYHFIDGGHCGNSHIVKSYIENLFGINPSVESVKEKLMETCPDAVEHGYVDVWYGDTCAPIDRVAEQVVRDYNSIRSAQDFLKKHGGGIRHEFY